MNGRQFNEYIHNHHIKNLEKHNYYFEKSTSHDALEKNGKANIEETKERNDFLAYKLQ